MAIPPGKTLAGFIDGFIAFHNAYRDAIQRGPTSNDPIELIQADIELIVLGHVRKLDLVIDQILTAADGVGFFEWSHELGLAFERAARFVRVLVRDEWGWDLATIDDDALKVETRRRRSAMGPAKLRCEEARPDWNAVHDEAMRQHLAAGLSVTTEDEPAFIALKNTLSKAPYDAETTAWKAYRGLIDGPLVSDKIVDISLPTFRQHAETLHGFCEEVSQVLNSHIAEQLADLTTRKIVAYVEPAKPTPPAGGAPPPPLPDFSTTPDGRMIPIILGATYRELVWVLMNGEHREAYLATNQQHKVLKAVFDAMKATGSGLGKDELVEKSGLQTAHVVFYGLGGKTPFDLIIPKPGPKGRGKKPYRFVYPPTY